MLGNSNINYVMGREAALNYYVYPNSTVLLMDSVADIFYTVSTDNVGNKTVRTFEFTEVKEQNQSPYVTRDELKSILMEVMGGVRNEHNQTTVNAADSRTGTGNVPAVSAESGRVCEQLFTTEPGSKPTGTDAD